MFLYTWELFYGQQNQITFIVLPLYTFMNAFMGTITILGFYQNRNLWSSQIVHSGPFKKIYMIPQPLQKVNRTLPGERGRKKKQKKKHHDRTGFSCHIPSDTQQTDECFPVVTEPQSGALQRPVSTQIVRQSERSIEVSDDSHMLRVESPLQHGKAAV